MTSPTARSALRATFVALFLHFSLGTLLASEPAKDASFDIPAGPALHALKEFSSQSGQQLLYANADLAGVVTNEVKGRFAVGEALDRLLSGTPLVATRDSKHGAVAVSRGPAEKSDPNGQRAAPMVKSDRPQSPAKADEEKTMQLPAFEVMGSKLLNMDLPRSVDDVQPYVIFERSQIQRSGAIGLEEFLKAQLPMNAVGATTSQDMSNTTAPVRSTFNLRGLGVNQTLILVDGRRLPLAFGSGFLQSDTNGIPLGAVERIEVLPTTSSGIYGGSATGGVINIILRRDYSGTELKFSYENSFKSDTGIRRFELSSGLSLAGGRTNVILSLSRSTGNALLQQDRDFTSRLTQRLLAVSNYRLTALDLYQSNAPLGATTNIRSATGSPLTLKNGTALNSTITFVPAGYLGAASDGGAALVANAGRYNLAPSASSYYVRGASRAPLLRHPDLDSALAMVRHQFTPSLQGFVEFSAGNVEVQDQITAVSPFLTLPATAPTNPFNQSISIAVPWVTPQHQSLAWDRSRRIAGGIVAKLPAGWLGELDHTWGLFTHGFVAPPRLSTLSAAVQSGVVDALRDDFKTSDISSYVYPSYTFTKQPYSNESNDTALRLSGPVLRMPSGAATLAALVETREDRAKATVYSFFLADNIVPSRWQKIDSVYAEARVPILGDKRQFEFAKELELQLAVRGDRYRTEGAASALAATAAVVHTRNDISSVNPTAGLRFRVTNDIMLRASYSRGFLPPDFTQLNANVRLNAALSGVVDPRRGNAPVTSITTISGGNTDLRPERSTSDSAGVVLTPSFLPGLRLSLDWMKIRKVDNLVTLGFQDAVNNESVLPGRVTRGANLASDPPGWPGPITSINVGYSNIARAEVEAYDLRLDYERKLGTLGRVSFYAAGAWEPHLRTQLVPTAPVVENIGVGASYAATNPVHFKGNAGATWSRGPLTFGWAVQHYGTFVINNNLVDSTILRNTLGDAGRVPAQSFHDVFATYRFDEAQNVRQWLRGAELTVGVKNVFNTIPAVALDSNEAYTYNPYGDPRLAVYFVSVKKRF